MTLLPLALTVRNTGGEMNGLFILPSFVEGRMVRTVSIAVVVVVIVHKGAGHFDWDSDRGRECGGPLAGFCGYMRWWW